VVTPTGTVTFKYDPFGRRIQKAGPNGIVNYVYDGVNAIEESDSSGNLLARYFQGMDVDEPLAELRSGTNVFYELVRIPDDCDQHSWLIPITIPGDSDHHS
jgi:YD repeat-containing protein